MMSKRNELEAKITLAGQFIERKKREYDELVAELNCHKGKICK